MTTPTEPTFEEAVEILKESMRAAGGSIEHVDPVMRANAIAGTINVIRAMQQLGWRVVRPLRNIASP